MRNIKLTIAYDGTAYCGWQRQKKDPTIQEAIESQLARIHTKHITLHGAGRTDAGVHARGMVAHFHTGKALSAPFFLEALNSMLPTDIRILEAEEVPADFHARFSAIAKTYVYSIDTSPIQHPMKRLYAIHISKDLNLDAMNQCLQMLMGEHDFACFETTGSRDKDAIGGRGSVRTILQADLTRNSSNLLRFTFTGDGFLRHMIRNIMGTIIEVGRGKRPPSQFRDILVSADRTQAGNTAAAHGLTLDQVHYSPFLGS